MVNQNACGSVTSEHVYTHHVHVHVADQYILYRVFYSLAGSKSIYFNMSTHTTRIYTHLSSGAQLVMVISAVVSFLLTTTECSTLQHHFIMSLNTQAKKTQKPQSKLRLCKHMYMCNVARPNLLGLTYSHMWLYMYVHVCNFVQLHKQPMIYTLLHSHIVNHVEMNFPHSHWATFVSRTER